MWCGASGRAPTRTYKVSATYNDGYRAAINMMIAGREAGRVTSGCPAPFLKKNIGMAYVPPNSTAVGTEIEISIRGQAAPARIVALPFYKRPQ